MIEIKEENGTIGVFKVCDLLEEISRQKILTFAEQKKFFILMFPDDFCCIKTNKLIKQKKQGSLYKGIVVILDGDGMKNFKDTYHRSSYYVDESGFRFKDFKKIFKRDDILEFWDKFNDSGALQIRGMKHGIFLRKKIALEVM
jgi:hypothetical protein